MPAQRWTSPVMKWRDDCNAAATLVGYYLLGLEPPDELTKYLYTCIIGELVALAFKSAIGDTTEARKTKTNTIGDEGKGAAG